MNTARIRHCADYKLTDFDKAALAAAQAKRDRKNAKRLGLGHRLPGNPSEAKQVTG